GLGVCEERPQDCPDFDTCPGGCGCDGLYYCSECEANKAGVDIRPGDTSCYANCTAIADAIGAKVNISEVPCTTVVRLDYQTFAPKGFSILCGGSNDLVDEATARAVAQADTGFGQSGTLLSGPMPVDEFVFYEAPGDFGGVGVVSSVGGLSVFG